MREKKRDRVIYKKSEREKDRKRRKDKQTVLQRKKLTERVIESWKEREKSEIDTEKSEIDRMIT